jgi:hypothetical protein
MLRPEVLIGLCHVSGFHLWQRQPYEFWSIGVEWKVRVRRVQQRHLGQLNLDTVDRLQSQHSSQEEAVNLPRSRSEPSPSASSL